MRFERVASAIADVVFQGAMAGQGLVGMAACERVVDECEEHVKAAEGWLRQGSEPRAVSICAGVESVLVELGAWDLRGARRVEWFVSAVSCDDCSPGFC